jgi:hypothetical protein
MQLIRKSLGYLFIVLACLIAITSVSLEFLGFVTVFPDCRLSGWSAHCIGSIFGGFILFPLVFGLIGNAILPKQSKLLKEQNASTPGNTVTEPKGTKIRKENHGEPPMKPWSNNNRDKKFPSEAAVSLSSQPTKIKTAANIQSETRISGKAEEKALREVSNSTEQAVLDGFPKASVSIEYRNDVAEAWSRIQNLPSELVLEFLTAIESDPKQPVLSLEESIMAKHRQSLSPFDQEELTTHYLELKSINEEAAEEFVKVESLLGDTLSAEEIAKKIKNKFT